MAEKAETKTTPKTTTKTVKVVAVKDWKNSKGEDALDALTDNLKIISRVIQNDAVKKAKEDGSYLDIMIAMFENCKADVLTLIASHECIKREKVEQMTATELYKLFLNVFNDEDYRIFFS